MTPPIATRQLGLSLIELMIAITLSSLLMLGVVRIFLSSKATYTSNQALSAMQESGRFAVELMARDIRHTGYKGQCLGLPTNHLDDGSEELWTMQDEPLKGWDTTSPDFIARDVAVGSHVLFVQFAAGGTDVEGAVGNAASNNTLQLDAEPDTAIAAGEVVLIADGLGCDLFENTSGAADALAKAGSTHWSYDYTGEFEVLGFQSLAYYVAEDDEGVPTLYRSRFRPDLTGESAEALVPRVASLMIEYGIATDRVVDEYVAASEVPDWGQVAAVRLKLGIETPEGLAQEFSTTIGLRNRLP